MKNPSTLYLTGLRGYSALAVFFIHSGGGGFRDLGKWAERIVGLGKYGVISFFVLSAFTLAMSIGRGTEFCYSRYMLRRFARIFPMYFVVIVPFWALGGNAYYRDMFGVPARDALDLFAHLTFLNLWDVRYQASVIGVEWTVPIEMWTYLIIPFLYFFLGRIGPAWRWMVFLAALILAQMVSHWHHDWLGAHWALENYLYCFIAGIIAWSYCDRINLSASTADAIVIVLLAAALFPVGGGHTLELWYTLLVMALILVLSQARYTRPLFENHLIVLIGNISFSFYLLHLPVLDFLRGQNIGGPTLLLAGLAVTSSLAYLCHIFVEKPALRLTRKQYSYDP